MWREAGRVADETVVPMTVCESRQEGRVSAELRHLKKGRGVHSPFGSTKHTKPLEL
jgi:hypothetical protein